MFAMLMQKTAKDRNVLRIMFLLLVWIFELLPCFEMVSASIAPLQIAIATAFTSTTKFINITTIFRFKNN